MADIAAITTKTLPPDWQVVRHMAVLREHLPELQERYNVSWLGVFGSYVRNEQRDDSDLDVLVEFSVIPGLLKFVNLQYYLSDLLGVQVDLIHRSGLRPDRRITQHSLDEAVPV